MEILTQRYPKNGKSSSKYRWSRRWTNEIMAKRIFLLLFCFA